MIIMVRERWWHVLDDAMNVSKHICLPFEYQFSTFHFYLGIRQEVSEWLKSITIEMREKILFDQQKRDDEVFPLVSLLSWPCRNCANSQFFRLMLQKSIMSQPTPEQYST